MAETIERLQASLGDRYRIERELGRGGMATVFLAQDLKHDREVAIKVLHPELAASLGTERFLREIRLAAKLQHPHILTLYDSGEADGLLYYVMPFVVGESLRDRLDREHQLPVDDAVRLTLEVADALGFAHNAGVVHRDIKPENILLSNGHALVADFGIARAGAAGGGPRLTETGVAVGTPLYMSPEQAVGEVVGPPSDIYSLACVLYEMLAGQPPFTGPNARAIMARHAMEQVPSLQVVRETVPDDIEDAIFAALSKVPADRPQTAAAFAELLGGSAMTMTATRRTARTPTGRMTATRRVPTGIVPVEEAPPAWRRWAIAGAAAVALVGGGFAVWRAMAGAPAPAATAAGGLDPHRVAVLYFEDQSPGRDLGFLADGLTEALIGALGEVRSLSVVSRGGVGAFRTSEAPRDSVARALQAGTLVLGAVEPAGDKLRVTVRLVDGSSGADFQRASFEQPAGDLLALRDTLAQKAAGLIRERLGEEIRVREQREGTTNANAWSLVQRAEQARKRAETLAAGGDTVGSPREFGAADSLLQAAEALDARWVDPVVARGQIAYRRSRLAVDNPLRARQWIDTGLGHAQRALTLGPRNPDALELRGNLRYWSWLLGLESDAAKARQLLADAQRDLEEATKVNPAQAGAWATLSHLYYQVDGKSNTDVNLAARRAYEEDAFLSNADVILSRLFLSSYDIGQFVDAVNYCREGQRRFPGNQRFVQCQLYLLTTKAQEPDVALAWRLADSLVAVSPPAQRGYDRLSANLMVAAVLARAGQADSARRLAGRSLGDADVDPSRDLAYTAAFVYALLGDKADAVGQLRVYLAAQPRRRPALARDPGWWFRSLEGDPAYQQLVGSGS